jgi:membrane fusion protein (multidrug efflux system)
MSQANITARDISPETAAAGKAAVRRADRAQLLRPILMIGGILVVVLGSLAFWLMGGRYVSSDDTYVDAAKVSLSTDVSGLVDEVDVQDNQHVTAGQVLFKIGQAGHHIAVANAEADLAQVRLDVIGEKRSYAEAQENIQLEGIQVKRDQDDLARYAAVLHDGGVTQSVYDDAKFQLQADQAKLSELQDQAAIQLSKLNDNPDIKASDTPAYQSALANLQNAQLDLEDSVVKAPYSGYVTMVESLQPGMYLQAGTAAFGLVSDTDIWITAQPKESDLTWVRPGQPVTIKVDTYPGQTWHGVVQSISPASGSEFSVLPAQNSSGNWVKVVQRIPVRVKITGGPAEFPLRDGMSAEISIDTKHHRHLSDLF